MFSAFESLLLRERVLDKCTNTLCSIMKKHHYASTSPAMEALKAMRSKLTFLIHKLIDSVEDFCASIQMSTATFYRIRTGRYVKNDSWLKLEKGYSKIATKEEFNAFIKAYYDAFYDAFSEG